MGYMGFEKKRINNKNSSTIVDDEDLKRIINMKDDPFVDLKYGFFAPPVAGLTWTDIENSIQKEYKESYLYGKNTYLVQNLNLKNAHLISMIQIFHCKKTWDEALIFSSYTLSEFFKSHSTVSYGEFLLENKEELLKNYRSMNWTVEKGDLLFNYIDFSCLVIGNATPKSTIQFIYSLTNKDFDTIVKNGKDLSYGGLFVPKKDIRTRLDSLLNPIKEKVYSLEELEKKIIHVFNKAGSQSQFTKAQFSTLNENLGNLGLRVTDSLSKESDSQVYSNRINKYLDFLDENYASFDPTYLCTLLNLVSTNVFRDKKPLKMFMLFSEVIDDPSFEDKINFFNLIAEIVNQESDRKRPTITEIRKIWETEKETFALPVSLAYPIIVPD